MERRRQQTNTAAAARPLVAARCRRRPTRKTRLNLFAHTGSASPSHHPLHPKSPARGRVLPRTIYRSEPTQWTGPVVRDPDSDIPASRACRVVAAQPSSQRKSPARESGDEPRLRRLHRYSFADIALRSGRLRV